MKSLEFENRAWEKAEYPRLVSNRVPLSSLMKMANSNKESVVFEISYHFVEERYFVEPYLYEKIERIKGEVDPCYGGKMVFFDSVECAMNWLQSIGFSIDEKSLILANGW